MPTILPATNGFGTPSAIPPEYRQKLAIAYIRQSTLDQVKNNTGSTESQRALVDHAISYGWPLEQTMTIDEDLGLSGTSSDQRTGFQRLLAMMDRGEVGLVLVRDAARLSRNRLDSARFWRTAMLADVLVEVNGRLRHPATDRATDRFGLEIESLLAWYENEQKTEMFQAAKIAKLAQRRAITAPPMGYVKAGRGEWEKGPEPARLQRHPTDDRWVSGVRFTPKGPTPSPRSGRALPPARTWPHRMGGAARPADVSGAK